MAKRIVLRIGDIFCMEMKNEYKLFFHYIGNDIACMGGAVIRVFKKRYDIEYVPKISEIINEDVMFYAHCLLRDGVDAGVWYKIGHSKDTRIENMDHIWFAQTEIDVYIYKKTISLNPLKNWRIWKFNGKWIKVESVKMINPDNIFPGSIFPYSYIIDYAELGYYKNTDCDYEEIKRSPHEYAESYVKRTKFEIEYYYHFRGSEVVREIIHGNGHGIKLSVDNPVSGMFHLSEIKFGDINWKYKDFITAEDFEELWDTIP